MIEKMVAGMGLLDPREFVPGSVGTRVGRGAAHPRHIRRKSRSDAWIWQSKEEPA